MMAINDFSLNKATKITISFVIAEKVRKVIGEKNDKIACEIIPLPVSVRSVTYLLRNGIDGEIFPENKSGQRSFIVVNDYKEFAFISSKHKSTDRFDKFHISQVLSADTGIVNNVDEDIFIY